MVEGLHISDFSDSCLKKLPTIKEDEEFISEFEECTKKTGINTDRHDGQKQASSLYCINKYQAAFTGPDGIYHPDHSQEYIPTHDGTHMFSGNTPTIGDLEIEVARYQKCYEDVLQRLSGNGVAKEHDKLVQYISPEQISVDQQSQNIDLVVASLAGAGLLVATLALSPLVRKRVKEAVSAVKSLLNKDQGSFADREVNKQGEGIQLV